MPGARGVVVPSAVRVLGWCGAAEQAQTPPSRGRRCTLPLPTPRPPHGRNIYCWLSSSAPTARPSYVMPGGAKKAVFPTLALHDHDSGGLNAQDQERQRRRFRGSLRKAESKDSPEKDKADVPPRPKQTGNGSPRTEVGAK